MPETVIDERFDRDGNLIDQVVSQRPAKVVTDDAFRQIKRDLRAHRQLPTPLSAGQLRQWLITLSQAVSYLGDEMDDEEAE